MKLRLLLTMCIVAALFILPLTSHALGKADIAVIDISVNSNCNWVITMKNVGTTQLPPTATDQYNGASISVSLDGVGIGAWRFGSGLEMPGSVASESGSNTKQISGTVTVGAKFSTNGSYEDTNLANNTLSKVLTCTPPYRPMPDLSITSLDFTSDCRPRVKVANLGDAAVSDWYFQRIYLQRRMDNVPAGQLYIKAMTPLGGCKVPQGTCEWIDGIEYVPQGTIRYDIAISGVVMEDRNLNNNSATISLPDRCKPGAALKKVQPQIKGPLPPPIKGPLKQQPPPK